MNADLTDHPRGRRTQISLASLYLDPNNYRIVDNPDYSKVTQKNVLDASVQRRTMRLILGKNQENVKDIIASFSANGWLELDPILVEHHKRRAFLVLEGNRRVAALKHLFQRYTEASINLGYLDPAIFSKVPVVIHELADEKQKLVLMGLHHISGKRRWPAINRALAIKDLWNKLHGNASDVCDALGISKQEFNLSLRTLELIDTYRESDYGDQFKSEKFTLFREIVQNANIREWLNWNQHEPSAAIPNNVERLFRWMSWELEHDVNDAEDDDGSSTEVGPVLTTIGHIRELAKIINDQDALLRLDETRSLQEATLSSTLLVKNEVDRALAGIDSGIHKLTMRGADLASEDQDRANKLAGMLQWLASPSSSRSHMPIGRLNRVPFNEVTQSQFSNLRILNYRRLRGLELDRLGRINLIVGTNNAGKTSLLEAIYLLTRQNDENALLDVFRWRGRFERDPPWRWFAEQIPSAIQIEGKFDDVLHNDARLDIRRVSEPENDSWNPSTFLAKLEIKSNYGDREQSTDVVLSSNLPPATNFLGQHWLCRCFFASPFWIGRREALANANKAAVEIGSKPKVVQFIKENIDNRVINIEHVDELNTFLVTHKDFDVAPDLSSFGDGMGRIFEIGTSFASAKDGVLLVDEFENAIHRDLLVPFTKLVQALATELNVQVFLTSHSKEALDAFLTDARFLNELVGFAIERNKDGICAHRYDGEKLKKLQYALDFDLRGIRGVL